MKVSKALTADTSDESKLLQLKLILKEKLDTLKLLDGEIIDLIEEDALATEIEQADDYKSDIHLALVKINKALKLIFLSATSTPAPTASPTHHEMPPIRVP